MNKNSLDFADYKDCPQNLVGRLVKVSDASKRDIFYGKLEKVYGENYSFFIVPSLLMFNILTGFCHGESYSCKLIPTTLILSSTASNYDKSECLWQDLKKIVMIAESGRLLTKKEIQICKESLYNNMPIKTR